MGRDLLGTKSTKGIAGLFGGGLAYELSPSFDIRAEYRGFLAKTPAFGETGPRITSTRTATRSSRCRRSAWRTIFKAQSEQHCPSEGLHKCSTFPRRLKPRRNFALMAGLKSRPFKTRRFPSRSHSQFFPATVPDLYQEMRGNFLWGACAGVKG